MLEKAVENSYVLFKSSYKILEERYYAHHRIMSEVEQLKALYNRVIKTRHAVAVQETAGRVLVGFFSCMAALIHFMEENKTESVIEYKGDQYSKLTYKELV